MEDTLGVFLSVATQPIFSVLILVLMEDTLGGAKKFARVLRLSSLNPCSNGRYSRRVRGVKALFQAGGE